MNKKQLYESIMRNVAKEVKKALELNESRTIIPGIELDLDNRHIWISENRGKNWGILGRLRDDGDIVFDQAYINSLGWSDQDILDIFSELSTNVVWPDTMYYKKWKIDNGNVTEW